MWRIVALAPVSGADRGNPLPQSEALYQQFHVETVVESLPDAVPQSVDWSPLCQNNERIVKVDVVPGPNLERGPLWRLGTNSRRQKGYSNRGNATTTSLKILALTIYDNVGQGCGVSPESIQVFDAFVPKVSGCVCAHRGGAEFITHIDETIDKSMRNGGIVRW